MTPPKPKPPAKPPARWRGWGDPRHPLYRKPSGRRAQPYQPGNFAHLVAGASSERIVQVVAAHLVGVADAAHLLDGDVPDYLSPGRYRAAVAAWSRAEARVVLVAQWLQEHGELDPDGTPWPAAKHLVELEQAAAKRRAELGLDPASAARLGRAAAAASVDIAALWADQADQEDHDG